MLPTGNTANPMMTLFRMRPRLSEAVAHTSRLANAVQLAAKAVRLFDISASLVSSEIHRAYGHFDPQAVCIPPSISTTSAPHRILTREGSTDSSGLRRAATASKRGTKREHPVHLVPMPSLRGAKAQALTSPWRPAQTMPALAVPVFTHVLLGRAHAIDRLAGLARRHSFISGTTGAIAAALFTPALVGAAPSFLQTTFIPAFIRGWQDVLWLLRSIGIASATRRLGELTVSAVDFAAMLGTIRVTSYLLVEAIQATIAGLAAAGYELYRNWDALKRLLSRSLDSAHGAGARRLKWMADKTRSTAAYDGNSIAILTTCTSDTQSLSISAARTARAMSSARGVERAAAAVRPVSMLRTVGRAAAVAAFATPLMLAQAPARVAFAAPLVSARIADPLSATRKAQDAIVVNYAPNVVIQSEHAIDAAALKGHVMEVLERHGRELHQVLAREIVRQQRRDF